MSLMDFPELRLRFTPDQYHKMADMGIFDGLRVELIDGEIYTMAAQKDEHAFAVRLATHALRPIFEPANTILIQAPLRLPESEPEPDVAVASGPLREIKTHPTTALLIVEVSDTSLIYDRTTKRALYARASIADYWIVNLVDRQVEVYRDPFFDRVTQSWRYADPLIFRAGDKITPLAAPGASVAVSDLVP
jgi:Uma2 family endonuclease